MEQPADTPRQTLIDEYGAEFCKSLEMVFGENMLSEGGVEGIEFLLEGLDIEGRTALDFGSGLGGVSFYLARKYAMKVTGVEINPRMIQECNDRISEELMDRLSFILSNADGTIPLPDESFDIVLSKGVIVHVENKLELFKELHRLLQFDGFLVINDWLSSTHGKWGPVMTKSCEVYDLLLYPDGIEHYVRCLEEAGFVDIQVKDVGKICREDNQNIVNSLIEPKNKEDIINKFDEAMYAGSLEGSINIVNAIDGGELKVIHLIARKVKENA